MDFSQLFPNITKVFRLRKVIIFCFNDRSQLRMSPKSDFFSKKRLQVCVKRLTETEIDEMIQNPTKNVTGASKDKLPHSDVPNETALNHDATAFEGIYNGNKVSCIVETDGLNLSIFSLNGDNKLTFIRSSDESNSMAGYQTFNPNFVSTFIQKTQPVDDIQCPQSDKDVEPKSIENKGILTTEPESEGDDLVKMVKCGSKDCQTSMELAQAIPPPNTININTSEVVDELVLDLSSLGDLLNVTGLTDLPEYNESKLLESGTKNSIDLVEHDSKPSVLVQNDGLPTPPIDAITSEKEIRSTELQDTPPTSPHKLESGNGDAAKVIECDSKNYKAPLVLVEATPSNLMESTDIPEYNESELLKSGTDISIDLVKCGSKPSVPAQNDGLPTPPIGAKTSEKGEDSF